MARAAEDKRREEMEEYYQGIESLSDYQCELVELAQDQLPPTHRSTMKEVHPEVAKRVIYCGWNFPDGPWEGLKVVDCGCGAGHDVFWFSKLVGQNGYVTGVDVMDKMVSFANDHIEYHREKFGYTQPNVSFKKGIIENLTGLGIESNSIDLVTCNCCLTLIIDDEPVYRSMYDVLKEGGEALLAETFSNKKVPDDMRYDKMCICEGFSTPYYRDFYDTLAKVGFSRPRLVHVGKIVINGQRIKDKIGDRDIKYCCASYRTFKLPKQQYDPCRARYNGGITDHDDAYRLDYNTKFTVGTDVVVDGEVAAILKTGRMAPHFTFSSLKPGDVVQTPNPAVDPFEVMDNNNVDVL